MSDLVHSAQSSQAPVTIVRPSRGWTALDLPALWEHRELIYFLLWRDLKIRYKQTLLGAAWAVIQPVMTVFLFSIIFGTFAKLPSDGVPYPLYAYAGILPWNLLAGAVNRSGTSLVSSSNLISKVYFPRLILPVSSALGALVDFLISLVVLFVMMACYRYFPGPAIFALPLWVAGVLALGLAVGTGLSALNVRYRDVTYLLTFLLQLWMYVSPVAYSPSIVTGRWRWLYELNPMAGFIQGFRWSLLGPSHVGNVPWVPAVAITVGLFIFAVSYFRQVERSFADLI